MISSTETRKQKQNVRIEWTRLSKQYTRKIYLSVGLDEWKEKNVMSSYKGMFVLMFETEPDISWKMNEK